MNDVVIASSQADAGAAEAVEQHHAELAGALAVKVEALLAAASAGDLHAASAARAALVEWWVSELEPHALAEEKALYPAAQSRPESRLLIEGMLGEHAVIGRLASDLAATGDPVRAAALGKALQVVFEGHLEKENDLVLPVLVAAPDVSVAGLLEGMHELLGSSSAEAPAVVPSTGADVPSTGHAGGACGCGEKDRAGYPELDARAVPHAIRHATIFGALDAVRPGGGLVLVAPHDPKPLLAQVEQRAPGAFEVSYLERGPEAWRLELVRRGTA